MIEPCKCSELDWRDVDMTLEHHPDCQQVQTIEIEAPPVMNSVDAINAVLSKKGLPQIAIDDNLPDDEIRLVCRHPVPWMTDEMRVELARDNFDRSFLVSSLRYGAPDIRYQVPAMFAIPSLESKDDSKTFETVIPGLFCPACSRESILHEIPNQHHPEQFMLYCRFTDCTGSWIKSNTLEAAIQAWRDNQIKVG
jgi:hypothetical protein